MNLLLSLFIVMFAGADNGSVRFMENPEVSSQGEVLLKDIAALEFLAPEDKDTLGAIKIAESYDDLKKMSSRDIMRKIKPRLRVFENHCECKLKITIPHAMVFRSLPGNFAVEKVQQVIERELKKDCAQCEYDVSPLNVIRGEVPAQYTRWNVDIRKSEWRGPSMVRVYFDNDVFSPLVLQSLIRIKRPILKLKQNLTSGSPVTAADYEITMTDVTYETARFAKPADLAGMETRRTLGKGLAIVLDDLIVRNIIRVGQSVAVEVKNAAFTIEMMGVAQRNGKLGDKIPVRLTKTQKNISAEIVSDARVRM